MRIKILRSVFSWIVNPDRLIIGPSRCLLNQFSSPALQVVPSITLRGMDQSSAAIDVADVREWTWVVQNGGNWKIQT